VRVEIVEDDGKFGSRPIKPRASKSSAAFLRVLANLKRRRIFIMLNLTALEESEHIGAFYREPLCTPQE
jgi:hypothetical protein